VAVRDTVTSGVVSNPDDFILSAVGGVDNSRIINQLDSQNYQSVVESGKTYLTGSKISMDADMQQHSVVEELESGCSSESNGHHRVLDSAVKSGTPGSRRLGLSKYVDILPGPDLHQELMIEEIDKLELTPPQASNALGIPFLNQALEDTVSDKRRPSFNFWCKSEMPGRE
jgi:hypothetical protein